jgi:NAD(P)H-dependent FMN reductase
MNPATSPARGAYRVAVIIGSTRPARICPGIAHWTREALSEDSPVRYDVIDLADVDLPFLDEPLATGSSPTSPPRCARTPN